MRHYLLYPIIIMAMLATGIGSADAQPGKPTPEQKRQFFLAKMKLIQQELNLTESQTNEFTPIYRQYNDEMSRLFDTHMQKEHAMPKTTKKDATDVVNYRIAMKIELLKLQKRYYPKIAKVLNAEQILRFDNAERKIQFQIMKRYDRRHRHGRRPPRQAPPLD